MLVGMLVLADQLFFQLFFGAELWQMMAATGADLLWRARIGPTGSTLDLVHDLHGLAFTRPAAHMREYLTVLKAILDHGRARLDGELTTAHRENRMSLQGDVDE
jgi:hypothetical protein